MPTIKRAIVSVTNKVGIVDFCKVLTSLNVEILSTGGTAKVLRENRIPVVDVAAYTASPEVLDGRLKTLHPKIEGGILGIRGNATHEKEMKELGILPIDLVVVNLYEFEKVASRTDLPLQEIIEQVDIGGPTMLRAAAKNYHDVTVIIDPSDYERVAEELKKNQGKVSEEVNFELAVKVFESTARYDTMISQSLRQRLGSKGELFPVRLSLNFEKIQSLRYGENPHQVAAYYQETPSSSGALTQAKQIHGKELSFNNILDCESALTTVAEFLKPACVIIKHTNPCGAALGKDLKEAFIRAKESDPVSSFGGILGLNREVDGQTAKAIGETFFECIIAPSFDKEALQILQSKKNLRLMQLNPFPQGVIPGYDLKRVSGGLLVQETDTGTVDLKFCSVPTKRKPTDVEYAELDFAWKLVKHIKSNAILFTKDRQIIGVGAGQMSRVDSVKIAVMKAQKSLKGSVVASDAFFPFRDGLDEAAKQGITAIVQPGGSVRDKEVIQAADEYGLAMVFTGMRHFKH